MKIGRLQTYPDLSCTTLLLGHIFNPDILFAIVSCGSHVEIGVFVPPVLAFEFDGLSLSWLITVLTKADSMADILFLYDAAEMLRAANHRFPSVLVGLGDHERMA